jgi:hypothetical protein
MINTGTTPVLPQTAIDDFFTGGFANSPARKEICYTGQSSTGLQIPLCVHAPNYTQLLPLGFATPIHPGVLPSDELSPLLS